MALVLKDRVKETTTTTGDGAYTLSGAVTGFQAFSEIGDGNTTYYCCTDGTDFEIGIGTYTASGTTLSRSDADVFESSNNNNRVNWGAGKKDIFVSQPADKAVFLDADGDIDFENTATRIKLESNAGNSGSGDPSISIAGGGPNYIRFHDGTDFTSTTNAVDIVYRTSPNDLLIERASGENIAEFGGDDGHVTLFYNNTDRLETTGNGIDITGHIDFLDSTAPNYENRLRFGAGNDLQIFSDGTHGYMQGTGSNDLLVAFDEVKFVSQDYSTFRLHITSAGDVDVSTGHLLLGDNQELRIGDGDDLKLYHDSQDSYIEDAGTGNLNIKSNFINIFGAGGTAATFYPGNAVTLYYNNVGTFETAADGVTVKATGENSARLTLQSDDASPTDWDFEGIIDFKADDDGGTPVNYARISGRTPDVSAGTFDSYLYFHTMESGTLAETMFLTPGGQLGLNKTNPKFTFYRPGGTTYAVDLQPPTTLRNNRTIRLPDGSGTLMLNRGDGELENTVENFQQHYISGGYFTAGEYLEIASISPTGDSRNYNISGKILAQTSANAQLLDINVGIRFSSTGSFSATILYNSSQMNTDHVEPVLWTNTSTDNIKLLIKAKTGSIHNLGVDLTLIQRAGYNDTTWNTTETPSDVTSVPSGYTEYTGEKAIVSILNGAVELYRNNTKKLETTATGVTVTGLLSATTKSFDIAHPTKENMRLRYGSLEGPENGVYVRGRLTGSSVIELPEHWAGLVHEDSITVQLTSIGSKQDLWVKDVNIERVQVCDANEDCFYMVMAERKDVDKLEVEYAAEV